MLNVKDIESFNKLQARRKLRARNTKQECLICQWEEFKFNKMNVDTNKAYAHLSDAARQKKIAYWGGIADRKLRDIQTTPHIDTIWPCSVEHMRQAKDIMERYLTEFRSVEDSRNKERAEWRLKRIYLVDLMHFKVDAYGQQNISAEDLIVRYMEVCNENIIMLEERHNKALNDLTNDQF